MSDAGMGRSDAFEDRAGPPVELGADAHVGYLNPGAAHHVAPFVEFARVGSPYWGWPISSPAVPRQTRVLIIDPAGDSRYDHVNERLAPLAWEPASKFVRGLDLRLKLLEDRLNAHALDAAHTLSTDLLAAEDPEGFEGRALGLVREDREEWERCVGLWVRAVRREGRRRKRRER